MFVPRATFHGVCCYIQGYEQGNDHKFLRDFSDWLIDRGNTRSELAWPWMVLCELYPKDRLPTMQRFDERQDAEALSKLFDLLDEYILLLRRALPGTAACE